MLNEACNQASTDKWIEGIEAVVNAFHDYFSPWELTGKINQALGRILELPFKSSLSQPMCHTRIHLKWVNGILVALENPRGGLREAVKLIVARAICPTSEA